MKKLEFYGYSDDTFGEYGLTGQDIDNCASLEPIQCIIDCGAAGRIMVIGQYSKGSCNNGCWMVGISKVNEDDDFPKWSIQIAQSTDSEHSSMAIIEIPDTDFKLVWFRNGNQVEAEY